MTMEQFEYERGNNASYRAHIAVVDTAKAQAIRNQSAEFFNRVITDWPSVQEIVGEMCKTNFEHSHSYADMILSIEKVLQEKGLAYNTKMLCEYFWTTHDGPYQVVNSEVVTRDKVLRFNKMVEQDMGVTEDYVLGRLELPNVIGTPFFNDQKAQEMFSDYNPRVIRKQDMLDLIECWRKLIVEHFKEVLMDPSKEMRWRGHLEAKIDRWEFPGSEPYNLEEKNNEIVSAYDLEYRIFELVRLYKSIDWMRDTVVLYGW